MDLADRGNHWEERTHYTVIFVPRKLVGKTNQTLADLYEKIIKQKIST